MWVKGEHGYFQGSTPEGGPRTQSNARRAARIARSVERREKLSGEQLLPRQSTGEQIHAAVGAGDSAAMRSQLGPGAVASLRKPDPANQSKPQPDLKKVHEEAYKAAAAWRDQERENRGSARHQAIAEDIAKAWDKRADMAREGIMPPPRHSADTIRRNVEEYNRLPKGAAPKASATPMANLVAHNIGVQLGLTTTHVMQLDTAQIKAMREQKSMEANLASQEKHRERLFGGKPITLQHRHFAAIASAVATLLDKGPTMAGGAIAGIPKNARPPKQIAEHAVAMVANSPDKQAAVRHLADKLARTNPKFSKSRFIEAALGEPKGRDEPNARWNRGRR